YIRLPRTVVVNMFSKDAFQRRRYQFYGLLLATCNYSKSTFKKGRFTYTCTEGELVTCYRELVAQSRFSKSTVIRLLKELEEMGRIEVTNVGAGKKIVVYHYIELTRKFIHSDKSPECSPGKRRLREPRKPEAAEVLTPEELEKERQDNEIIRLMLEQEQVKEKFSK
ncbi:MAG: hypothetical protein LUD15_03730, partial [Bacteroides sp.]|nr:hypothetical protein [Bacteroides sp.]